ncbi:MAG: hypothetical protein CMM67_02110 [Rhodospirillaceae bacterium]|nr:hypothetical protein [Rhodospirillaceae bacterium]OUT80308.1 MAG: hypothetical protein CBB83_01915 [Rhodospirillaceae bacterium TMED23]|tara:strand:- start:14383 stop:15129 length:747 start_codon:yes stop_codon:yes gene_type:complete
MSENTELDRAYWISWYDLEEINENQYLDWLHNVYIPDRLTKPGVLNVAHYKSESNVTHPGEKGRLRHTDNHDVASGDRYILIFTGIDAHVFADPPPSILHQNLSERDQKMLSLRLRERINIMVDEARVDGPEAKTRVGNTLSPCIQLGNFNSGDWRDEDELTSWYAQWRMPCMTKLEGSVATRKLVSVSGWAKHAILYEYISVDARNRRFLDHESHNPDMEAWTDKVVRKLNHAPGSPNLAKRIWPKL